MLSFHDHAAISAQISHAFRWDVIFFIFRVKSTIPMVESTRNFAPDEYLKFAAIGVPPISDHAKIHVEFQNLIKILKIYHPTFMWVKFARIWPSSHRIRAVQSRCSYFAVRGVWDPLGAPRSLEILYNEIINKPYVSRHQFSSLKRNTSAVS